MSRDALTLNYSIWGIFENQVNHTPKIVLKNTVKKEAANELFSNQKLVKKIILNSKIMRGAK